MRLAWFNAIRHALQQPQQNTSATRPARDLECHQDGGGAGDLKQRSRQGQGPTELQLQKGMSKLHSYRTAEYGSSKKAA